MPAYMSETAARTLASWIIPIILGAFGLWITIMNWWIFFSGLKWWISWDGSEPRKSTTWGPLIGGGALALAILACPVEQWKRFWWIPLVADWGCLPGISFSLVYIAWLSLTGKIKRKDNSSDPQ